MANQIGVVPCHRSKCMFCQIGCEKVGDMPCVYCADREGGSRGKA